MMFLKDSQIDIDYEVEKHGKVIKEYLHYRQDHLDHSLIKLLVHMSFLCDLVRRLHNLDIVSLSSKHRPGFKVLRHNVWLQ